ncbi:recombination-associated protein RdgC [Chitinimonas arctica]|uniref:Recombination-associated protein RdgC n=1 Tax=Chitinimonas arctica TaxID=2594795 RepID=A0A516SIP8_9NEIS|nr:recombination-associated protein RdgC [Chitinimonas arctica]QDQ28030.1 recombination-associated protein RdgC [Chitinimonas arctica]
MWFKNLQLYRLTDLAKLNAEQLDAELQKRAFVPLGKSDKLAAGWIPPASHAPDLFAYPGSGAMLIALKTEEKLLPSSVVKEMADERIADIEARELRKVGKKETKEIRERVAEELLPRAFSRSRVLRALIDFEAGWIWVDSPTPAKAELLIQLLRETLGSLPCKLPQTQLDPVTAMSTWLEHGAPRNFTLDADCVLKAPGDGGAQVTCRRHDLGSDEVKQHLKTGKLVTQLALSWDDRLAFVLTDKLHIKRLAFLELLEDQIKDANAEDAAAMFDTSFTLLAQEGRGLVNAVIEALGDELGEMQSPAAPAPAPGPAVALESKPAAPNDPVDVPW